MTGQEIIGALMLAVMLGAIFIGFPISFTLLFLAFAFGHLGLGAPVFDLAYYQMIGLMKEDVLSAVPLFIFMGYMVQQAGLMERLFGAFRMVLAPVRGALFLVVILTATVFAMATGIVGAAVTVLGIMAGQMMIRSGYDARLSAGAIAAGGTLGILIPPSVMLVVMGPVIGVSVAKLYAACFLPGLMLAGFYIVYCMGRSFFNPRLGPPVPQDERVHSAFAIAREAVVGMAPLIILITATLGSILAGLATTTEAAAMGATGSILLTAAYGRLSWPALREAAMGTLATTSMVLFLAIASNVFGAVFARLGTATLITETLLELPLPPTAMLILLMALIFLLGWPFEWPAIVLVFVPIFYPVVQALKIDPIWFGALIAVNLQTAFLSPPVAMSAYYLKQVVPEWSLLSIYGGMMQFMLIQMVGLALMLTFPEIATWLPNYLFD
jgi:tripartite ATP-independent transporter DctM subunit